MSDSLVGAAARPLGSFYAFFLDTFRAFFKLPFSWRECVSQIWFIAGVSIAPGLLIAIPYITLVTFTLNLILIEIGAADLSGAGAAFGAVAEIGPVVTALVVGGAGGTAMAADLGSRTIREEISAMQVLGIDPIQRLIVPRAVAATLVTLVLYPMVTVVGLVGSFYFSVFAQDVTPGAFVANLTLLVQTPHLYLGLVKAGSFGVLTALVASYLGLNAKGGPRGVGEAVNQAVVYSLIILFFADLMLTIVGNQFIF